MTIGGNGVLYVTPANLDAQGAPSLAGSQLAIGWNISGGLGENDFFQHRGAGSSGGYSFYNYSHSDGAQLLVMRLKGSGDVWIKGDLNQNSDAREKANIQPISNALGRILDLRGVRFNWKDMKGRDERVHLGLVAQEVRVAPKL